MSAPPCVSFHAMKNGRPRPTSFSAQRYTPHASKAVQPPDDRTYSAEVTAFRRNLPHHRSARAVLPYTRSNNIPPEFPFVKKKFRKNHKLSRKNSLNVEKTKFRFCGTFQAKSSRRKISPGAQCVKKASQSLLRQQQIKSKPVFCRGVYLAENTSQAASVEFVPRRGTNYARSRLPKFVGKACRGFSTVSAAGEKFLRLPLISVPRA